MTHALMRRKPRRLAVRGFPGDECPAYVERGQVTLYGPVQELPTPHGTILFQQNETCEGSYGNVFGMVRVQKHRDEWGYVAEVKPLSSTEKWRYIHRLKRLIEGPLHFW
jgi:hypothetical protein